MIAGVITSGIGVLTLRWLAVEGEEIPNMEIIFRLLASFFTGFFADSLCEDVENRKLLLMKLAALWPPGRYLPNYDFNYSSFNSCVKTFSTNCTRWSIDIMNDFIWGIIYYRLLLSILRYFDALCLISSRSSTVKSKLFLCAILAHTRYSRISSL